MAVKVVKKGEPKPYKAPVLPIEPEELETLKARAAKVDALEAQVTAVTESQAKFKRERFVHALEKAGIKPEYHKFAIDTLGELDLGAKSDLAKIDAFAKEHSAMTSSAAPAAERKPSAPSAWPGAQRTDGRPRLGDYVSPRAVPVEAGGERS